MAHRTIVITGASDGIGAAAARRLRRSGENVVVVGRSETKTAAVAAELDADYFVADFLGPVSGSSPGRQNSFPVSAYRRIWPTMPAACSPISTRRPTVTR